MNHILKVLRFGLPYLQRHGAQRAARSGVQVNITQSSLLYEILYGIHIVKALGREVLQVERFRRCSQQLVTQNLKSIRAKELVNPIIETVSVIGFGMLVSYISYKNHPFSDMFEFLT